MTNDLDSEINANTKFLPIELDVKDRKQNWIHTTHIILEYPCGKLLCLMLVYKSPKYYKHIEHLSEKLFHVELNIERSKGTTKVVLSNYTKKKSAILWLAKNRFNLSIGSKMTSIKTISL